jgi:hypothetical protein
VDRPGVRLAELVATLSTTLGPLVKARELLEPEGRWLDLRAEIEAWFARHNQSNTDTVAAPMEYLVALGQNGS